MKRAAEIAETYNKEMATNILNTTTYKAATEGNLGAAIQRVGGEGGGEEEEAQQFTTRSNLLSPSPPTLVTSWIRCKADVYQKTTKSDFMAR